MAVWFFLGSFGLKDTSCFSSSGLLYYAENTFKFALTLMLLIKLDMKAKTSRLLQ